MARKSRWNTELQEQVPKKVKYRTWVYARISVETDKNEDSIDNQIALCREHIDGKDDLEFAGVFTDSGFTGTNMQRPDYRNMMEGIIAGDVRCVVVKDLSRLGRTYIEVGELLFDTFAQYDVRFISVNDRYDSNDEDAGRKKLLLLFKNLMNHVYSVDLGKKLRASFSVKQQRGEVMGAMPPYGFVFATIDGRKCLDIEPESAAVVKMIFDMRLDGHSTVKITQHLNANGITAPKNHYYALGILSNPKHAEKATWTSTFICNLLRNEVYIGNLVQGKYERHGKNVRKKSREECIIHEGSHPAIIDKAVFDDVQRLMNRASRKYSKKGNTFSDNIFVGKVYCSRCGKHAKRGNYQIKSKMQYIYYCRYCHDELLAEGQSDKSVLLEQLEDVVVGIIRQQVAVCLDVDELIKDMATSNEITSRQKALQRELARLRKSEDKACDMLTAAYTHHIQGFLDEREFDVARAKFEQDKKHAASDIARLEQKILRYDAAEMQKNDCLSHFLGVNGFEKLDRQIVESLIDRIEISPVSDEISVTLAFRDSFAELKNTIAESGVYANAKASE